jgi:hypothetical protein
MTATAAIRFILVLVLALQARTQSKGEGVEIQASGVNLHFDKSVVVEVRFLRGSMEPLEKGKPVTLDDANSFEVHASYARLAMSMDVLADVMNHYAFGYQGAPLKNMRIEAHGPLLRIRGTIHKGVDLPFSMEGRPQPDSNGCIRIHADKVSSAHIPIKGLLHLFGEDLAKLVNTNEARGVRIEGDDIVLLPSRLTPAPHILGRVTGVGIEGDRVVETFGGERDAVPLKLPRKAKNYIYHRGGVLRFGKLTMTDADLELIDQHPGDSFDFSLPDYNRQLVAGYSKNTLQHGLIVYVPDYAKLNARPDAAGR